MAGEMSKTLALIKPDAVKAGNAEEIKQLIELHGFNIVAQQKMQLTRARAEEFYGEHRGKPFFPRLVEFMTSGPIWALVLAKPDAWQGWRALMGPTNTFVAREKDPRSLRALYGTDGTQNALHGSDSDLSAAREIKFYFPALVLEPLLDPVSAKLFIAERLQPALSKALTALAREKPSAEKFEAITFLAEFLLNNNPNKPKIVLPDSWDPSIEEEDDESDFIEAQLAAAEARAVAAEVAQGVAVLQAQDKAQAEAAEARAKVAMEEALAQTKVAEQEAVQAAKEAAKVPPALAHSGPGTAAMRPASQRDTRPPSRDVGVQEPQGVPPEVVQAAADFVSLAMDPNVAEDVLHGAATKVQSSFRGLQARQEVAAEVASGQGAEQAAVEAPEQPVEQSASAFESADGSGAPPLKAGSGNRERLLRAAFKEMDRDNSGFIDKEEFKAALAKLNDIQSGKLAEQAQREVDAMDANADNKVSLDEYLEHVSWVAGALNIQDLRNYLKDAFHVRLANRAAQDGSAEQAFKVPELTPEQAAAALAAADGSDAVPLKAGSGNRERLLRSAFEKMDRDNTGFIDKAEFKAALAKLTTLDSGKLAEHAQEDMDAMDANADNTVSLDEFLEHISWIAGALKYGDLIAYLQDAFSVHIPSRATQQEEGAAPAAEPENSDEQLQAAEPPPQESAAAAEESKEAEQPGASKYSEDQQKAAVRIQAAGRGMLDRRHVAQKKATAGETAEQADAEGEGEGEGEGEAAAEAEGGDEAAQEAEAAPAVEGEKEAAAEAEHGQVPEAPEFTEDQQKAAVKIQAAGRGMLDRRRVAKKKAAAAGAAQSAGDGEAAERTDAESMGAGGAAAEAAESDEAAQEAEAAPAAEWEQESAAEPEAEGEGEQAAEPQTAAGPEASEAAASEADGEREAAPEPEGEASAAEAGAGGEAGEAEAEEEGEAPEAEGEQAAEAEGAEPVGEAEGEPGAEGDAMAED